MKRIVPVLLATFALSACASARAEAPSPGTDWRLETQEDSARLTYGGIDGPSLSLECRGGQDPDLQLFAREPRDGTAKPTDLSLSAGVSTQRYPALVEANGATWELMARARKSDPIIQAFRETGWLVASSGGAIRQLIPQHNTTAVADFFEWCH